MVSTVYTRYAQVVRERLRTEIEYCSNIKIGNRSRDCITKHIMKNGFKKSYVTLYVFTRCLVLKIFFEMLLSKLHCFSYFYQRPLNKYFVLCFYIQRKKATSIYWFKKLQSTILLPLNLKKKILKISSIRFLSFCNGQESQSKGIELRSQLTKPNNWGGKIELYFHYHFHHNHL